MDADLQAVREIASRHGKDRSALISVLQDVHTEFNYLPEGSLDVISREMGVPVTSIYGVATFFRAFSFQPRGRHLATMCLGTACHVRGASRLLTQAEEKLGISSGETTRDRRFTLETVNCLGCCAVGPLVVVDGEYHGEMDAKGLDAVLEECS